MTCLAAILTWNDHARCRQTLAALLSYAPDLSRLVVYDNGSDQPFVDYSGDARVCVVRGRHNLGAGGGQSQCLQAALAYTPDTILYVEDDFVCRRPLPVAALAARLTSDASLGRIAIADRPVRPKAAYFTHTLSGDAAEQAATQVDTPFIDDPAIGRYQRLRLAWSNYPCLISAHIASTYLVHGWSETRAARAFYADNWGTLSCCPGWFWQARPNHHHEPRDGWRY